MIRKIIIFSTIIWIASAVWANHAPSPPPPAKTYVSNAGPLTQLVSGSLEIKRKHGYQIPDQKVVDYTWLIINTMRQYPFDYMNIKDMRIPISLVWSESGFDPNVRSSMGCIGLFQINPRTARFVCKKYGIRYDRKTIRKKLATDLHFNVRVGLAILDYEMASAQGDIKTAIMSYKCGPTAIRNGGFMNPRYLVLYSRWHRIYNRMV